MRPSAFASFKFKPRREEKNAWRVIASAADAANFNQENGNELQKIATEASLWTLECYQGRHGSARPCVVGRNDGTAGARLPRSHAAPHPPNHYPAGGAVIPANNARAS